MINGYEFKIETDLWIIIIPTKIYTKDGSSHVKG